MAPGQSAKNKQKAKCGGGRSTRLRLAQGRLSTAAAKCAASGRDDGGKRDDGREAAIIYS